MNKEQVKTCFIVGIHLFFGYLINSRLGILGAILGGIEIFIGMYFARLVAIIIQGLFSWMYPFIIESEEENRCDENLRR